jgi:predicted DNA-binding transcriptional regulator AlpA
LQALGFTAACIDAALAALQGTPQLREPEAPLLSPDGLCQQLQISRTTLWRLNPPSIRVGGRKRYNKAEVLASLSKQKSNCEESK